MQSSDHSLLAKWLAQNERTSLCVISPHLDDAVYSTFASLADAAIARCEVVTVVTSALPGRQTRWSALSGFPDSQSEHAGRCQEDLQVLGRLGVEVLHLGAVTEDAAGIRACVEEFVGSRKGQMRQCAFLLPAGAGRQAGMAERIWRRARRQPDPLGSHPEHVCVRDVMTRALRRASGALWGYYAEIPYVLNDSLPSLHRRLERIARCSLQMSQHRPDPPAKLQAAQGYRSQADLLLGRDQASRLGFASHPERLFLQAGLQRPRI